MTGATKILHRCTICNNFHASYLVDEAELGKCYLCPRCWKARSLMDPGHIKAKAGGNKTTETSNDLYPLERGEEA